MLSSLAKRAAILLTSLFLMTYFFAVMIPEAHSALDISVNPTTRTVVQGRSVTFTVTVPYIPCIPPDCATITLTSQPYYSRMPVTFSPSQHTFTATRSDFISTMSVEVGPSVPTGSYNIIVTATSDKPVETKSTTVWVEVTTPIVVVTPILRETDWALSNPTMSPAHPKVGDRVAFAVTLTALSSNAGYPQTVRYTFALDGTHVFFDEGKFDYPGPAGSPIRLEAGTDPREIWLATSGSHVVEWTVVIVGLVTDPNTANNHVSLPFSVGPAAPAFDFTLSVSPASVPVEQGETAHCMVQVTYSDPSYAGTVMDIQLTGLGPGMDWDLAESGDLAITTKPTTPTGTYTITATGSAMGLTRQASAAIIVTAGQPPMSGQTSAVIVTTAIVTTTETAIPSPGLPDLTWIIIGILAVLIVIFAAFALRRRGPAYPPAPSPSAQPAPPTPTEKPKPSMLYCVHCGTENPPTNEYCGKCGQKLLRAS